MVGYERPGFGRERESKIKVISFAMWSTYDSAYPVDHFGGNDVKEATRPVKDALTVNKEEVGIGFELILTRVQKSIRNGLVHGRIKRDTLSWVRVCSYIHLGSFQRRQLTS